MFIIAYSVLDFVLSFFYMGCIFLWNIKMTCRLQHCLVWLLNIKADFNSNLKIWWTKVKNLNTYVIIIIIIILVLLFAHRDTWDTVGTGKGVLFRCFRLWKHGKHAESRVLAILVPAAWDAAFGNVFRLRRSGAVSSHHGHATDALGENWGRWLLCRVTNDGSK